MTKKPANHNKTWTPTEVAELKALAAGNTPTRAIGLKLGRTEGAVESKADELDVSLKPANQSPYGPRQKG